MKPQIKSALLAAPSSRVGAPLQLTTEQRREMRTAGYVGPDGGLTRKGSIARDREMNKMLDEML